MLEFILKYWLEFAFGIAAVLVTGVFKRIGQEVTATRNGMREVLRKDLIQMYNKGIAQGYLKIYERENLCDMFKSYEALGGNHGIKDLVEKALDLPTEPKKEKEK